MNLLIEHEKSINRIRVHPRHPRNPRSISFAHVYYIVNIVEGNLLAMKRGSGAFNIWGGERVSVNDLARKIVEIVGSDSEIIYSAAMKGDAEHTWADVSKARREFGYVLRIGLDEGLKKYVKWVERSINQ